tara:strand:+ start:22627 stop:23271 length:645 start_codon:yes stop_codon:yes gene_type:complete
MSYYRSWFKDTCTPLGRTYRNYKIQPSDKIYYNDYQYKLNFEGNIVHYDIVFLSDLYKTLNQCVPGYAYRLQSTTKSINVYFHSAKALDEVIDRYQHTDYLQGITGPIDEEHLTGLLDSDTEFVYRNKYWYGKYPIKICFERKFKQTNIGNDLKDFIAGSFEKDGYRLFDSYTDNWYQNYLWVTQEEYDNGYPFLKLSYGEYINKVQKVKLMEK